MPAGNTNIPPLEYNPLPSISHINKPQIEHQPVPMDIIVPHISNPQIDMDTTVPPLTYSANPQIEYKKQAEAMDTTVPKPPIEYINSLDQYQLPPINDDERIVDLGESMDEGVPERPAIMQKNYVAKRPSIAHQERPAILQENKPAISHVQKAAIAYENNAAIEHQERPSIAHQERPAIVHENKPAIEYVKETANKNHPIVSYQHPVSQIRNRIRGKNAKNEYNLYNTDLQCNECNESFKTKAALKNHQKNCSIKGYNCEECGKSFPTQNALKIHKGRMHKQKTVVDKYKAFNNYRKTLKE